MDYQYFSKHYKLIAIDLDKQVDLENPNPRQQINFVGRLDRDDGVALFFITEKSEEKTFEFPQNAVTIVRFSLLLHTI